MIKNFIVFSIFCLTFSYADFIGLTPSQLDEKIKEHTVVIDIRTPGEWTQTGVIPSSKKIMFFEPNGNYNTQSWLDEFSKHIKDQNEPFILVCRSGNRTSTVGNFLSKQLKFKNVYHLENGINSWLKENRSTQK